MFHDGVFSQFAYCRVPKKKANEWIDKLPTIGLEEPHLTLHIIEQLNIRDIELYCRGQFIDKMRDYGFNFEKNCYWAAFEACDAVNNFEFLQIKRCVRRWAPVGEEFIRVLFESFESRGRGYEVGDSFADLAILRPNVNPIEFMRACSDEYGGELYEAVWNNLIPKLRNDYVAPPNEFGVCVRMFQKWFQRMDSEKQAKYKVFKEICNQSTRDVFEWMEPVCKLPSQPIFLICQLVFEPNL